MTEKKDSLGNKPLRVLAGAMLIGLVSVVIYAAHVGGRDQFLAIASVGVLLFGASAAGGGTLGFLFGIPRTLQDDGAAAEGKGDKDASGAESRARIDYRVNNNLEQISDWLTKILVGVGLTQIAGIREGFSSLTAFAARGLGPQDLGQVFASGLFAYSAVLGFLFGYLWTRLFYAEALREADQVLLDNIKKKVESTERELEKLKTQSKLDAEALNLAYRQINPSPDLPKATQDELNAAIAAASRPVKVQIFNQAWQIRSENWREDKNKPKMELAIPLFRALIKDDADEKYHMNHGQLGFALKDSVQPKWAEAEAELSTAIRLRGSWRDRGWLFYELARAICRIMTDPAFDKGAPADPERKAQILEDLKAAAQAPDVKRIIRSDQAILKWLAQNKVTAKALRLD